MYIYTSNRYSTVLCLSPSSLPLMLTTNDNPQWKRQQIDQSVELGALNDKKAPASKGA